MIDKFANLGPIIQALLATCFTWFVTDAGAVVRFFNHQSIPLLKGGQGGCLESNRINK
jgi:hypothetical protein